MEILDQMGQPLPGDAERLCDIGLTERGVTVRAGADGGSSAEALRKWPGLFAAGS